MGVLAVTILLAAYFILIPQSTQSCIRGSPKECLEAKLAPGSRLAGEGFNIVKMQRMGVFVVDHNLHESETCMLCRNPYEEGKFQRVPQSVVDWIARQNCSMMVASSQHKSIQSLLRSRASRVENNWEVHLGLKTEGERGLLVLAGSQSNVALYTMRKIRRDIYTFLSHEMVCSHYSYRLSDQPPHHPEFQHAVSQLPQKYTTENKQHFYKVIDTFGTHFLSRVTVGGMIQSVTSLRQCLVSIEGLPADNIQRCLDVEATISVRGRANGSSEEFCQELKNKLEANSSFSRTFSDRLTEVFGGNTTKQELLFSEDPALFQEWLSFPCLPGNPDVVSYSLDPLHELLPLDRPLRKELGKAVKHYILERGLRQDCSKSCMRGSKRNPQDPCVCACHGEPGLDSDCCPTKHGLGEVIISELSASDLDGDDYSSTDAYIKLFNSEKMLLVETPVIWDHNSPKWIPIKIGYVSIFQTSVLTFEVWDKDKVKGDDLLGTCTAFLKKGRQEDECKLHHGVFFYKIQVTCGPHLSGPSCSEYVSSPMSDLRLQPIPKYILTKMLFEDELLNEEDEYHVNNDNKETMLKKSMQSFCLR